MQLEHGPAVARGFGARLWNGGEDPSSGQLFSVFAPENVPVPRSPIVAAGAFLIHATSAWRQNFAPIVSLNPQRFPFADRRALGCEAPSAGAHPPALAVALEPDQMIRRAI